MRIAAWIHPDHRLLCTTTAWEPAVSTTTVSAQLVVAARKATWPSEFIDGTPSAASKSLKLPQEPGAGSRFLATRRITPASLTATTCRRRLPRPCTATEHASSIPTTVSSNAVKVPPSGDGSPARTTAESGPSHAAKTPSPPWKSAWNATPPVSFITGSTSELALFRKTGLPATGAGSPQTAKASARARLLTRQSATKEVTARNNRWLWITVPSLQHRGSPEFAKLPGRPVPRVSASARALAETPRSRCPADTENS